MEYITVTKDDPAFNTYLDGTFSLTERALPIETYHAQTSRERVTFRIVSIAKLDTPKWWKIYFWSCRPELLVLTLGPAVAAWLSHKDRVQDWTPWPSWFAMLGLFFLHTAAFLFNDVQDHRRGSDRLNRRRGSQVIQKGWVRAVDMQRWAWVNGLLSVLFGVPAFLHAPLELSVICGLAFVALVVVVKNWWADWGVTDLALALLFGPLLTTGISLASYSEWTTADLWLGVALGLMTAWTLQIRQFEKLFRSRPEGFRTFLGHLDFDHAKRAAVVEGIALIIIQPWVAFQLGLPMSFWVLLPLVSAPSILLIGRIGRAASPLSSSLLKCESWALAAQWMWMGWWILALGSQWL